uniref:Acylsugar acetyltransferase n=1 Tax=Solanum habrochaites TaxID=62890 RepID=K4HRC8_SOLHA|nr:acylsugar acetyltransferase [Solanum habrochaites]
MNCYIEIQSRKMLKPSAPTPDNLRRLKLSLFDQLDIGAYVPILFNYLPNSTSSYDDDKLQKSLSETLTKFYPFAGRFRKDIDPFSIDCNDEGIEYVRTKVNADDLAQFLRGQAHNDIESSLIDLLPVMDRLPSSPLFGVQVNVFNNGGVTIGIQILHMVSDAFTLVKFVNEWAHTTLTGTMPLDNPGFGQLPWLFPARALPFPLPDLNATTAPNYKNVTKRFLFDALAIENLRKTIKDNDTMMKQPSRVVVVMSLIWKVFTHISSAKNNGNSRDSSLVFVVNLRGKLSCTAPSLQHVVGNCVITAIANKEGDEARRKDDELNDFVKLVGNTVRDTCEVIGKAESVDDISSLAFNNLTKCIEKILQGDEMGLYSCSSWCGFPWYEADFGWGKPFWVSSVSFGHHGVSNLMDTKDGDGIQVTICLKENDMIEFERDTHILSSTSKLAFHSLG